MHGKGAQQSEMYSARIIGVPLGSVVCGRCLLEIFACRRDGFMKVSSLMNAYG